MDGKLVGTKLKEEDILFEESLFAKHSVTLARLHLQYRTACNSVLLFIIECASDIFHKDISNEADCRDSTTQGALAQDLSCNYNIFLSEV